MKWSLLFKEKMKASIILVALMLGIIVSNLLEKRITSRNDFTISSIFEDRLQPSTYLYEMRTLSEQRLFVLEEYLHAEEAADRIRLRNKMQANYQKFDALLLKYKATFLVAQEQIALADLNKNLIQFSESFAQLKGSAPKGKTIISSKANITKINNSLGRLNKLQSEIGKELLEDYKKDTYYSSFLNAFQILLAIVIGIIILTMVANSSLLNKFDKKVNLN